MHESHLIKPVIKGITEHAKKEGARRVTKVNLKIGVLSGVGEASFRETFKLLAQNTPLENAKLELILFPGSGVQVVSFDIE